MPGLKLNTQHLELKRKKQLPLLIVNMVSRITVNQVFGMMSDDDFAYLVEYEPDTISSLCNALSIELQENKENESISNRRNLC